MAKNRDGWLSESGTIEGAWRPQPTDSILAGIVFRRMFPGAQPVANQAGNVQRLA